MPYVVQPAVYNPQIFKANHMAQKTANAYIGHWSSQVIFSFWLLKLG